MKWLIGPAPAARLARRIALALGAATLGALADAGLLDGRLHALAVQAVELFGS